MKLKEILLTSALLLAAFGTAQAQQQTQVIAHRGFWKTPRLGTELPRRLGEGRLYPLLRLGV